MRKNNIFSRLKKKMLKGKNKFTIVEAISFMVVTFALGMVVGGIIMYGKKSYAGSASSSLDDFISTYNDILNNYNEYDFYVVMNMIKSDNYNLYKKRFPGYNDDMLDELFVEDALNWLDDMDNPYGMSKIWKYLNS